MKFDIVLCFITPHAGRVTGFLSPEPIDETREDVIAARDEIQSRLHTLNHLTIFTRDLDTILPGGNLTPLEITLPEDVIKNSVMISQIVEVSA